MILLLRVPLGNQGLRYCLFDLLLRGPLKNHPVRFASTPPMNWRGISPAFLLSAFLLFCFFGCVRKQEVPVPKPVGYFRLDTPVAEYQHWDSVLPFNFDYSKHATLNFQKRKDNVYWIDIYYPTLSAMFKMTCFPVKNNLHNLMWSEEEQVMFHVDRMMTDDIQYSIVNDANAKVFGRLYDLEGKYVATPFKFWLTDSTHFFVKGTLFFDFAPNNDSLLPVINFLKRDALFMIETWQWKKK